MKRGLLSLAVLVALLAGLFSVSLSSDVSAQEQWVIDGNKVYIDDSNVYLSANPHTLSSSGWVEFELLSKRYEGEVDLVWGFDRLAGVEPSKPQIWVENAPHTKYKIVRYQEQDSVTVSNVVSYEILTIGDEPPDIGNSENNTKLIRLTVSGVEDYPYYQEAIPAQEKTTFTVAYNSHIQHSPTSATFYFIRDAVRQESYIEYYDDWKPLQANFRKVDFDYEGMVTWQLIKLQASIQRDKLYRARVWIEIPFGGMGGISGKYFWGVKPASETFAEALASGHAYFLDPWYNSSWGYRKQITIDGSTAGIQTDYSMMLTVHYGAGADAGADVYLNSHSQADFDDIRFTESDGTTLLYHWRESYTASSVAVFWVEFDSIPADPNTANFYIYYGNAGAGDGSDADNTFLFHDDFPGIAIDGGKWDGYVAGASVAGGILTFSGDDISNQYLRTISQFGATMAFRSRFKLLEPAAYVSIFGFTDPTNEHIARAYYDSGPTNRFYNKDGAIVAFTATNWVRGAYGIADILVRGNTNASWFWDGVERNNSPLANNPPNDTDLEALFSAKFTEFEVDWVLVRKYCFPEPTWGAWGSEETIVPPPSPAPGHPTASWVQVTSKEMSLVLAGCVVVFFSVLGFWRQNALPFMLAAGASVITGFYWYDAFATDSGLTLGILLVGYSLVCVGYAFRCIFWRDRVREESDEE